MTLRTVSRVRPADPGLRTAIALLTERRGRRGAARELGVNERTLARIIAGASARVTTLELLQIRFLELIDAEPPRAESGARLRVVRTKLVEPKQITIVANGPNIEVWDEMGAYILPRDQADCAWQLLRYAVSGKLDIRVRVDAYPEQPPELTLLRGGNS